jgi:hypothetical protein
MKKDISNETVFVLAILAILISILSVATVFFEVTGIGSEQAEDSSSKGTIKLEIKGEPKETNSQGMVSLNIANNT